MNKSDIDLLSCLLDGELEDARAQELLERLQHDTALQAEFERLTRINKQYREAVFEIEREPLSPKLQSLFDSELSDAGSNEAGASDAELSDAKLSGAKLSGTASHQAVNDTNSKLSLWQAAQQKFAQWLPQPTWTRAAMASVLPLAVAIFVVAIFVIVPRDEQSTPSYLQHLSGIVSGESTTVGDITIAQTFAFKRQDDSLCKRFVMKTSANDSVSDNTDDTTKQNMGRDVVACYVHGQWREVISAAMTASQEEALYVPASADAFPLDFYMEEQMRGIPLEPQQERELLHKLLPAK